MPKVNGSDVPESLKPYHAHGIDLSFRDGDKNAKGDCPFCGTGSQRFQVSIATGKCRCFVCGEGNEGGGMNAASFLQRYWKHCADMDPDLSAISRHRKIHIETMEKWMITRSVFRREYLIPGFNVDSKITQLYKYRIDKPKSRAFPTPGVGGAGIYGMNLWEGGKPFVFIAEGVFDAMKLWEILGQVQLNEEGGGLKPARHFKESLLSSANVIGIPGVNGFKEEWVTLLRNKTVHLCLDNDHPKVNPQTGKQGKPAGVEGCKRIAGLISKVTNEINYLKWGEEEGYSLNLKDGTDLRDLFTLDYSELKVKSA